MVIKPDNSLNAKRMIRVNISEKMPFSPFLTDEKGGNLQHPTCFPQHPVQSIDSAEEKQSGQKHPCPDFKGIETYRKV
ncbi:hypothetical protein FBR06_04240 [Betaproteobacteria bacterium PRO4]|nr:hypothetical protein [Betaproteobacteria bacterium PRO4]